MTAGGQRRGHPVNPKDPQEIHRYISDGYLYEALKMKTKDLSFSTLLPISHLHAPTSAKAEGAFVLVKI